MCNRPIKLRTTRATVPAIQRCLEEAPVLQQDGVDRAKVCDGRGDREQALQGREREEAVILAEVA